jgi:hypothetical protein
MRKSVWMSGFLRFLKEYAVTHPHFRGDEAVAAFRRAFPAEEPSVVNWYGQGVLQGKENGWYAKLKLSKTTKSRGHRMEVTLWRSKLYPHKTDHYNLNNQKKALRHKALTEGLLMTEVIERAVSIGLNYQEPLT